jgi:hypothetical protein
MATIDNRGRKSATILTERDCTKRVTERTKLYDKKCRGLYVSIIPAGVATFFFKFTDKANHKQRSRLLGIHSQPSRRRMRGPWFTRCGTGWVMARTSPRRCVRTMS